MVPACPSPGSSTPSSTASRWRSAPTACSAPSCCSSSCSSLSSSPSPPAAGKWAKNWASPCSPCTLCSSSSVSCWRTASSSVPSQSDGRDCLDRTGSEGFMLGQRVYKFVQKYISYPDSLIMSQSHSARINMIIVIFTVFMIWSFRKAAEQ